MLKIQRCDVQVHLSLNISILASLMPVFLVSKISPKTSPFWPGCLFWPDCQYFGTKYFTKEQAAHFGQPASIFGAKNFTEEQAECFGQAYASIFETKKFTEEQAAYFGQADASIPFTDRISTRLTTFPSFCNDY